MYSTCFGHQYIPHQELATVPLNYHIGRFVLGSLCVGNLVLLGLSGVRVAGQPATRTPFKPSRTKLPAHDEPRTKRPMW